MRLYELGPDVAGVYRNLELPRRRTPYDASEIAFMDSGACRAHDPRFWDTNTSKGRTTLRGTVKIGGTELPKQEAVEFARHVCTGCPVLGECREFIGKYPEGEGIWAALMPEERA